MLSQPTLKDGKHQWSTGATRSPTNHRYDLLSPVGLARLAQRAHMGVEAHGLFNAERGLPVSVFLNHAIAHIYSYLAGNREDDDLAAACWNLLYAIDSEVRHPELNDDLRGPGGALPEAARVQA